MKSLTTYEASPSAGQVLLALDTGRRAGWSVSADGKMIEDGTFEVYKETKKKKVSEGERLVSFFEFVSRLCIYHGVTVIAFEQISGGAKGNQILASNGYRSMLTYYAETAGLPLYGFAPATIKKAVTGTGRAKKDDVIHALLSMGHVAIDDNHADALGCAITFWKERESVKASPDRPVRRSAKRKVDAGKTSAERPRVRKGGVRGPAKGHAGDSRRAESKPVRRQKRAAA